MTNVSDLNQDQEADLLIQEREVEVQVEMEEKRRNLMAVEETNLEVAQGLYRLHFRWHSSN